MVIAHVRFGGTKTSSSGFDGGMPSWRGKPSATPAGGSGAKGVTFPRGVALGGALRRRSQRLGRLRWKASKMRPSAPSRGSVHPSPDGVHPSPRWGAAAPEAGEHCVRRKPKTPRRECFQGSLAFRARCVYDADILSPTRIALGKPGAGRVRSRRRAAEGAHPTLGGAKAAPPRP